MCIRDRATTGWTVPLIFCLVLVIPFAITGYIAAAPGYVDDQLATSEKN